jgi:oxygen-independent coproporphyrinogen-3 oxidase
MTAPMEKLRNQGIGLYLHVPFCQTKCSYCDFNTYAGQNDRIPAFIDALAWEVRLWGRMLGRQRVRTVFLGGGTPSLLTPGQLGVVMNAVRETFAVDTDAEVTAEANPEDVTVDRMAGFRELGVNRLSMGAQTLEPGLLKLLGRRHTAEKVPLALKAARTAGFANVNLDLIYGLPRQEPQHWRETLEGVLAWRPEHISAYCLTLEEGTPLTQQVRRQTVPDPDPDLAAEMYEVAEQTLGSAGYRHYEISNWALPEMESRHNLVYWRNEPYLGVGPGAHSCLFGHRFWTVLAPDAYVHRVARWRAEPAFVTPDLSEVTLRHVPTVADVERIDERLAMAETAMLALRLAEGLEAEKFSERFGVHPGDVFGTVFAECAALGLLDVTQARIWLTARGRLLGNEVFQRLLAINAPAAGAAAGGGHVS